MQLHPTYDAAPLIELSGDPGAVAVPAIRQRRRLLEVLRGFGPDEWAHPSRCAGWSNRDVVVHLESTDRFWTFSLRAGLGGEPTRFLDGFDPARTPADLVAGAGDPDPTELLERVAASSGALVSLWEGLGEGDWTRLAEAPPGHLRVSEVTHHALWDSWVHERDVLAPLGREQVEEPDEVLASLRYGAALGPAVGVNRGEDRTGAFAVVPDDIGGAFTVRRGTRVEVVDGVDDRRGVALAGSAAELIDALCFRRPLAAMVADEDRWLLGDLAEVFDLAE